MHRVPRFCRVLGIVAGMIASASAVACGSAADGENGTEASAEGSAATRFDDDAPLESIAASRLCVTAGRVETRGLAALNADVGGMRGVVAGNTASTAEVAFTYLGPSQSTAPLANGEVRRQIGLKLRARNSCNLVYVMWHVDPSPGVFVSVKRGDGKVTHADCGATGYLNLRPDREESAPPVQRGEPHKLRARIVGTRLVVHADDTLVWEGSLPADSLPGEGAPGIRSDNGAFDFELRIPGGSAATLACPADPRDLERP